MAQEAKRLVSPVGRIVWGSVYELNTRDKDGRPEPDKEKHRFTFGLAIRKDDPRLGEFLAALYHQAVAGYPNNPTMKQRIDYQWQNFGRDLGGSGFKFKVKDGDAALQRTGKPDPNSVGCFVVSYSTKLPITCSNAQNQQIDPKTIERGYFVDVATSIAVNEKLDQTAGIFVNPSVVRFLAHGEQIMGGISIEDAFAGHAAPTQLPPGASPTPVAPAGGLPGFNPPSNPMPGGMLPNGATQPVMPGNMGGQVPGFQQPSVATMPGGTMVPSATVPMQAPGGYVPQPGAPAMAYPSNPPGFPTPGPQQPGSAPSPTGYPINPATGQPFQPHTGFVMPGGGQ